MLQAGCGMLGKLLAADPGYRGPRVPCGQGHEAGFVSYRGKVIDTVLGPLALTRAWYHCAACGHGLAPRDSELSVAGQAMSPGLRAMNDQAAAAGPFAKAARLLENLAGVRLTVKRVERAAEASGTAAATAIGDRAAMITARTLVPFPPSPLPDKLYAAIDGTGVPVTARETAGRDGKGADGRARTREVKLAVFFTQDQLDASGYPVRDRDSSSYIATFEPAATFAGLVEAEGIRRGAGHIRQLTIPGDGAAWIWNIATAKFPEATQIVDLFHAREHLHDLARPPGGPRLRRHRRHLRRRPHLPPRRNQEDRAGHRPGLLREQRPAHALPLVPLPRPVRRLRSRRIRLQSGHRPAPQTLRHALDHRRRQRHHHTPLPAGQLPRTPDRLRKPQPDASRLISRTS
jgi:hypothetical protein